ncbi:hypothetical protein A2159_00185 [Candidatus Woesebacteria bacterium RBG_13_34_9]|uniref:Glycosyltransferase RgtA/B/C/D-like domain-containing protein n=1 Tax=Candidatus Woesebacteria bacterium RBG_13_34_9 TaxID=1802477 RepID=A0A1F7X3U6_9BACT|nr:MAG: hypothetical protein A2159_00185 [Candidatus Woesebacteria bacterium RBG_13_34_9]
MKNLNNIVKKLHTPKWLFLLLSIVFILRIPSFFEPYSYGDEMIYLSLGEAIRRGIPLYSAIHDNKPPLLYIMAAIAGNLFWFKAILTIWILATIYIFWKFMCILFPNKKDGQRAAVIIFALLTTLPLLEGNIVNAELFMIGSTILAFTILLSKNLTTKKIFLSGVLFSISILFKVPAVFDIPAIIFLWITTEKLNNKYLKIFIKKVLLLAGGIATPIIITAVWFFLHGALKNYIFAAFMQNVGYLSSWRPSDVEKSFLVRNAPLLIRGAVVAFGLVLLYLKKKSLSKKFIFASSWLLLTLFAVTLSERPYPHYLIQSVPPISILLAILITEKTIEQILTIIPVTLALFVPFYYHFWYYKTIPYYVRFTKLITNKISYQEYLTSFGSHVPRDYKIANFLLKASNKNNKVFIWGEASPIYALSKRFPPGKYITDYHIKDFSSEIETINILTKDMPEYIVIMPNSSNFLDLGAYLSKNYAVIENIDGVNIWKLLSPNVRSLLSS